MHGFKDVSRAHTAVAEGSDRERRDSLNSCICVMGSAKDFPTPAAIKKRTI